MPASWIFDELPPSGARRGDDPAQHAFRPDLATFVREVIQNANDQALAAPTVSFTARTLEGDVFTTFARAIAWPELTAHLRATADTRTGARLNRMLGEIERTRRLPVLCVEDRNTVGLTGDEDDPQSHFRALCKDTLFSHKREASAGGSYGLGKSVLWAFSGVRTVLFGSRLADDPKGHSSPRLIGRAELPSHRVDDTSYVGSGWLGAIAQLPGGRTRAESVWGTDAARLLDALGIPRSNASGTTILVVAVRDPTEDDEDEESTRTPQRMLARIGGHASAEFWPAMLRARDPLVVQVDGHTIAPRHDPLAAAFCACLDGLADAVDVPRNDGDIALRTLTIEIPRRRDETRSVLAEVDLIVRLAEAADRPGVGRIAAFRGPGMIVRHWDATRLASALRPFHAVLRCGRARGETEQDLALERFLRAAEPPGHDDWIATVAIKDEYIRGAQAALTQLHDRVMKALRELLAPSAQAGVGGPDRLRRRLAITPKPARSSGAAAVGFGALAAELRDGRWCFEGEIRPRARSLRWTTELAVRQVGEDGSLGDDVPIASLELVEGAATSSLAHGRARVDASASGAVVSFRGSTVALRGDNAWTGEIALELVTAASPTERSPA